MSRRRAKAVFALGVVVAMVATACTESRQPRTEPADVAVFGPWRGDTADQFRDVLSDFEDRSGITVSYTGTSSFAKDMVERVATANLPDVALFPQPGLLLALQNEGHIVPLPVDLEAAVQRGYAPKIGEAVGWLSGGAGIAYRLSVKSLVWYPPEIFEAEGYDIPETWDALRSLASRMVSDGYAPWCLGVEAFGASGWPATDWIEDIVLRMHGPEVYDEWLWGDVPFNDDRIAAAFVEFDTTTLFSGSTVGGRKDVLNTATQMAHDPMFDDPPACLMHRQASFAEGWLPEGTEIGVDVDVFELPGEARTDVPLLIGGTFIGALTDSDDVWTLLEYLASPEAYFGGDGTLSPNREALASEQSDPFAAWLTSLVQGSTVVRFDGSDVMYPGVGSGSFLDAMLDYIGTGNLTQALETAQSGWDTLQANPLGATR